MDSTTKYNEFLAHIKSATCPTHITRFEQIFPNLNVGSLLSSGGNGIGVLWMTVLNTVPKILESWEEFSTNVIPNLYATMDRRSTLYAINNASSVDGEYGKGDSLHNANTEVISEERIHHIYSVVNNFWSRHSEFLSQLDALLTGEYNQGISTTIPAEYTPPSRAITDDVAQLAAITVSMKTLKLLMLTQIEIAYSDALSRYDGDSDSDYPSKTERQDTYKLWLDDFDDTANIPLSDYDYADILSHNFQWPGEKMELYTMNIEPYTGLVYNSNHITEARYISFCMNKNFDASLNSVNDHNYVGLSLANAGQLTGFVKKAMAIVAKHKLGYYDGDYTVGGEAVTITLPDWVLHRVAPVLILIKNLDQLGIKTSLSATSLTVINGLV